MLGNVKPPGGVKFPSSITGRPLERMSGACFGAAKHFVLHALLILPQQALGFRLGSIDEESGALEVLDEAARVEVRQILHQHLEEMLALPGVASFMEEEEIFPQFEMGRLVREILPDHHHRAEDHDCQGQDQALIAPQESHGWFLTPRGLGAQHGSEAVIRTPIRHSHIVCEDPHLCLGFYSRFKRIALSSKGQS